MDLINFTHLDLPRRRIFGRASGMWSVPEAVRYGRVMDDIVSRARHCADPIDYYADLTGLMLLTNEVSQVIEYAMEATADLRIGRFVVKLDSALQRLQSRRILSGLHAEFYDNEAEAIARLGWEESYVDQLLLGTLRRAA